MLLTIPYRLPIKFPGILLTIALCTSPLGILAVNPAFADSHAPTKPADTDSTRNKSEARFPEPSSSRPLTVIYESAMTTYRFYDDNSPGDWKAANERVGEIGGWRTYAKEAYEAAKQEEQTEADSGNSQ